MTDEEAARLAELINQYLRFYDEDPYRLTVKELLDDLELTMEPRGT